MLRSSGGPSSRIGRSLRAAACACVAALCASPALAWSRGYVVDYYFFPGWAEGDKDANCPNGTTQPPEWKTVMKTPWRSDEDVAKITGPGQIGYGSPLGNRGPKPGQNVYRDPTLIAEPDMILSLTGNVGFGFDLDGDKATGLVSPDGKQRGLDNNIYRALGCHHHWRGGGRDVEKPRATEVYDTAEMRAGAYTVVIHLSGEGKDPRNDKNVRVGVYLSKDPIVKDANGEVSAAYSYRVDPDPRFMTVFDAKSVNGVVTPKKPLDVMRIRDYQTRGKFAPDLILEKPQIDLAMREDGKLHVRFGGYREWRYVYESWGAGGVANEISGAMQIPKIWYNLQRYADWKPKGAKGPNTHISSFYVMDAVPAFVVSPEDHKVLARAEWFEGESHVAKQSLEAMATSVRNTGGDPSFRLEGGAAAWPAAAPADAAAPPADSFAWAKRALDVRGGIATRDMQLPGPTVAAAGGRRSASE